MLKLNIERVAKERKKWRKTSSQRERVVLRLITQNTQV